MTGHKSRGLIAPLLVLFENSAFLCAFCERLRASRLLISCRMQIPTSENAWIFEGIPEHIDINVAATSSLEGGYVMALALNTNTVRIAATRFPAKYVKTWCSNARRFGLPTVVRVMISRPHLRYEALKRAIANHLSEYKDAETDSYQLRLDEVADKASGLIEAARA